MLPEDLNGLTTPQMPAVHPSGDRVAYVQTIIETDEDRYHRTIWVGDERDTHQFTAGPGDSTPKWSPDGTRLAFLRNVEKIPQLAVIPADGGEAALVTDFDLGVTSFEWSPDGSSLAVTATTYIEDWKDLDDEERARKPRRVTTVPYRFDNLGWLHDRRSHIWLVDADGVQDARCLTPGDLDEKLPTWHPDGTHIAYLSDLRDDRSLDFGASVMRVEVDSGDRTEILPHGAWAFARYSPEGGLHLLGDPEIDWPSNTTLWRLDGTGLVSLTAHLDRSASSLAIGPAYIEFDDGKAYVMHEDAGTGGVAAVHSDGTVDHVIDGPQVASDFSIAAGASAYVSKTPTDPGTLFFSRNGEGAAVAHSSDLDLVEAHHFTTISEGTEIDVWVYLPPGDEEVPVLVNIHGGPASQYGFGFFDEFQVYAGAGYGVIACNPRGSAGRGRDFVRAVIHDGWGVVDVADVNAAVHAALARNPRLDGNRMGIMGGSYGGFLTAWIIATDHRWKSAVVERGLLSYNSFAGTSDIGGSFPRFYTGADHGDPDAERVWSEKSPLTYAGQTTTPTLVIHAENDFRCPIEQAERYFMALLKADVEVEFLRFPGEGHEMSRSGKPRHRVERFDFILDWHERHLPAGFSAAPSEE
ncbi:MAG TPA: S9 family peptidase [Acidimicrobiia bacterium]|jgi:dipeptidyl aminopeptidase/acylaminoacyl peptidase